MHCFHFPPPHRQAESLLAACCARELSTCAAFLSASPLRALQDLFCFCWLYLAVPSFIFLSCPRFLMFDSHSERHATFCSSADFSYYTWHISIKQKNVSYYSFTISFSATCKLVSSYIYDTLPGNASWLHVKTSPCSDKAPYLSSFFKANDQIFSESVCYTCARQG